MFEFAVVELSDSVTIGIISGLAGAFSALLTKLPAIIQSNTNGRIAAMDALQRDYTALLSDLRVDLTAVKAKVAELQNSHANCQVENAKLTGEVNLLKLQVHVLSNGKLPLTIPEGSVKVETQEAKIVLP